MQFNKQLFEPLVGKIFTVQTGHGQSIELHLNNIATLNIAAKYESFVLNFDPPSNKPALPDDSYVMTAEGFGPELIHLSATHAGTPDPMAYYYEAVFNVYIG